MKKQFLKMLHNIMNPKNKPALPKRIEVEPEVEPAVVVEAPKRVGTPVLKKKLRGKPKLKK